MAADGDSGRGPATPSPSLAVKVAEMQKDVKQLQEHDKNHTTRLGTLENASLEYKLRLENGVKVFADVDERLDEVERRTTPQPPSIMKVASFTFAIVMAGASALWGLSTMLADRPTTGQIAAEIAKIMDRHDTDVAAIRGEQKAQKELIQGQNAKLDSILQRLPEDPAPRRPRRRSP